MVKVSVDDLKCKSEYGLNFGKYLDGYRIVYFYADDSYKVGAFSGSIEMFMIGFTKREPIEDESDIPPFISIDDLLDRYLKRIKNVTAVGIYKTDGTCIAIKEKNLQK